MTKINILEFEKLKKNIKYYNSAYLKIINFTIRKINILEFERLLNCANNLYIMKK